MESGRFDRIRELNSTVGPRSVRTAVRFIDGDTEPGASRDDDTRCLRLALLIDDAPSAEEDPGGNPPVAIASNETPTTAMLTRGYLRAIEPAVLRLRVELFEADSPPFPGDYAGALTWLGSKRIGDTLGRSRVPTVEEETRIEELKEDLRILTEELEELAGYPIEHARPAIPDTAKYLDKDGRRRAFGWSEASPLFSLSHLTRQIAKGTGFPQPDIVKYILCGEVPRLDRLTASSRAGATIIGHARTDRAEVTATFYSPDIRLKDLKKLLAFVREVWNSPREISDDDDILWRLVEREGDPWRRRQPRNSWPKIVRAWNEETGRETSVTQLRMRWSRISKKLDQLKVRER